MDGENVNIRSETHSATDFCGNSLTRIWVDFFKDMFIGIKVHYFDRDVTPGCIVKAQGLTKSLKISFNHFSRKNYDKGEILNVLFRCVVILRQLASVYKSCISVDPINNVVFIILKQFLLRGITA
jgi:hypothetical protein